MVSRRSLVWKHMPVDERVAVAVTFGGAETETGFAPVTPTHVFAGEREASVVSWTGGDGALMKNDAWPAAPAMIVLCTTRLHVEFEAPVTSKPTTRLPFGGVPLPESLQPMIAAATTTERWIFIDEV